MFKHILVPTDGSKLAARGVREGVMLAKALGARVTGLCVLAPYSPPMYGEAALYNVYLPPAEYKRMAEKHAAKALAAIEAEARRAGVPYAPLVLADALPWAGIVKAARQKKCDAIVMASHGRGGLGGVLLGSVTVKVLAQSRLPVLVAR